MTPNLILPSRFIAPTPALMIGGGMQELDGMERYKKFGSGATGLQGQVPSTCFHLDATDSASYSGSGQTWSNLTGSPADGSGQTAFDMYRGNTSSATTDDPTFNGSAGSASAYWSTDGGDYLSFINRSPTPGFLKNIHKTTGGTAWWVACAFNRANSASQSFIFSTSGGTSNRGIRISATNVQTTFSHYSTSVVNTNLGALITNATPILAIFSGAASDFSAIRYWINNRTGASFSITPAAADTTDAAGPATAMSNGTVGLMASGTLYYALAGGNAYLDNTAAGKIFDFFNTKHSRTYA